MLTVINCKGNTYTRLELVSWITLNFRQIVKHVVSITTRNSQIIIRKHEICYLNNQIIKKNK